LFQPQHPAHLLDGKFVVQQTRDLFERQAQILECENAIEARQLIGGVVAIAGEASVSELHASRFTVSTED
jgi:hypothetical protein